MSGEEEIERMLADLRQWIASMPPPVFPENMALEFFARRLSIPERRSFLLGCASRVACFIDPGISVVLELSLGQTSAYSSTVDHLFERVLKDEPLGEVALLERYDSLIQNGILRLAFGGQGNSLVEELLDPAMSLLRCALAEDGLSCIFEDEDGEEITCLGYSFGRTVCRIANGMIDPNKFPEMDIGGIGITPWVLESMELDSQWKTVKRLSQLDVQRASLMEEVEHYSRKCRAQNCRVTHGGLAKYTQSLLDSWKTAN